MKSTSLIISLFLALQCHAQLAEKFELEAQYQHLNGVVLVKKADSIYFEGCYGTADGNLQNTLHTRFDIGSITKQFTAAAMLHLAKEGKLSVNDPINIHLKDLASKRWKKVTIHHLLTHTGGVPSLYQTDQGLELFLPEEAPIPIADLIERFNDVKLIFSPGNEFNYSNSGYILLAAIIEKVSGQSYKDFMKKEIFESYGLSKTTVGKPSEGVVAQPFYGYRNDLLRPAPLYDVSWFIGSGGIYSTATDLIKWVETINDSKFLNEELRSLFLSNQSNAGYGYGWQFLKNKGVLQHDGGNAGFISMLSFNPESEETIAILTNRSFEIGDIYNFGKSADYVGNWTSDIWDALAGESLELLPQYQYAGAQNAVFGIKESQSVSVSLQDTLVSLHIAGQYPSRIVANTPLAGVSDSEKKMLDIARYLEKTKYWSLAKYCDGEMKFVMYSGMMSIVMRIVKKKVGKALTFTPFYVDEDYGLIRMKGTERILDLIVYFDDEGRVVGIFENGFLNLDQEVPMLAYPIGENKFYLDGIPYGETSVHLEITNDRITFQELGRSVSGTRK